MDIIWEKSKVDRNTWNVLDDNLAILLNLSDEIILLEKQLYDILNNFNILDIDNIKQKYLSWIKYRGFLSITRYSEVYWLVDEDKILNELNSNWFLEKLTSILNNMIDKSQFQKKIIEIEWILKENLRENFKEYVSNDLKYLVFWNLIFFFETIKQIWQHDIKILQNIMYLYYFIQLYLELSNIK